MCNYVQCRCNSASKIQNLLQFFLYSSSKAVVGFNPTDSLHIITYTFMALYGRTCLSYNFN